MSDVQAYLRGTPDLGYEFRFDELPPDEAVHVRALFDGVDSEPYHQVWHLASECTDWPNCLPISDEIQ